MGRIFGGVDFKDITHKNVSNLLVRAKNPYSWSKKESFDFEFFSLFRINSAAETNQPFSNQKDIFILYDGQIYIDDFELENGNTTQNSNAIIQKLILIYRDNGPEYLCGLNGMYLIVLWDKKLKTLYITNDCFGLKPCYYWRFENEFFFGTQYEPFTHHPKFAKDINHKAIIDLMIMGCVLEDGTLFKNIRNLQPGSLLTCEADNISIKKYSTIEFSDTRWGADTSQLVDEMECALEKSVAVRLKRAGSTLIPLSGGFDSRTMAAICKRYCSDITTVTYGLKKHTDVKIARRVAKQLNLPNIFIHQGADYLIRHADKHLETIEGTAELFTANIYPVLEHAQDRYKDIVSGYFGDCLHGENITNMIRYMKQYNSLPADALFKYYSNYFPSKTLSKLLSKDLKVLVDRTKYTIKNFFNKLDGPIHFKCLLTDLYYRNRHYISSQLNILEDCARVHAPFTDLDYIKFIITLPPIAFEDKHLYQKLIKVTFRELAHICNSNSKNPLVINKKSIVHKISLEIDIRKDYILEIPRQLATLKRPQIKPFHWSTFACVEDPYRRTLGNIMRGLHELLEPFFDIKAIDRLFFSTAKENPIHQGFELRRLYSFALWLKKYFS